MVLGERLANESDKRVSCSIAGRADYTALATAVTSRAKDDVITTPDGTARLRDWLFWEYPPVVETR